MASSLVKILKLASSNQLKQAYKILKKKHSASSQDVWLKLSGICGQQGLMKQSMECCFKVIEINPGNAIAHSHLGNIYYTAGDINKALQYSHKAVQLESNNSVVIYNLGLIYRNLAKYDTAITLFNKAIQLTPTHVHSYNAIASCYQAIGDLKNLEKHYNKAIELKPDLLESIVNLGYHYSNIRNTDLALEYFNRALFIDGNNSAALSGLSSVYLRQGKKEEAYDIIRRIIDSKSITANALGDYAILSKDYGDPEEVISLSEQRLKERNLPNVERSVINFGLGNIYDRLQQYDLAFKYYEEANRASFDNFDKNIFAAQIQSIIDAYNGVDINNLSTASIDSIKPIFIIGMPRSGTSLIEQILSRHSMVFAAGELTFLMDLNSNILKDYGDNLHFPNGIADYSVDFLNIQCEKYMEKINSLSGGRINYVTDKMPSNYLYVGLIKQLFPNSRIIHCIREPRDTCLSIYFQNFQNFQPYSADLVSIGHVYLGYHRLMKFWTNLFTENDILNIHYEDVVGDIESNTRKLIDFCGLQWEESCLEFYKSENTMQTASFDQVNKPIYTKSVERWRNYKQYLEKLNVILEPVLPKEEY